MNKNRNTKVAVCQCYLKKAEQRCEVFEIVKNVNEDVGEMRSESQS